MCLSQHFEVGLGLAEDLFKGSITYYLLLEQKIEAAEDIRYQSDDRDRPCLQVNEVDVFKVNGKYYFISGEQSVFILNDNGT